MYGTPPYALFLWRHLLFREVLQALGSPVFSAGVDSIATLITNRDRIDSALYIGGFDFPIERDTLAELVAKNRRILDHLEIPKILVHTNQQQWGTTTGVVRNFRNSGYLAAVAFVTDPILFLVPSSHTLNELHPVG